MRKTLALAAALAFVFVVASPAGAQTNPYEGVVAGLTASNASPAPGSDVVIAGEGCEAGATVNLSIGGTPAGTATAADDGKFSATITAPSTTGRVTVNAQCGATVLGIVLDVGGATGTGTGGGTGSGTTGSGSTGSTGSRLALTGAETNLLLPVGLALVAIGGIAVLAVRQRRLAQVGSDS